MVIDAREPSEVATYIFDVTQAPAVMRKHLAKNKHRTGKVAYESLILEEEGEGLAGAHLLDEEHDDFDEHAEKVIEFLTNIVDSNDANTRLPAQMGRLGDVRYYMTIVEG